MNQVLEQVVTRKLRVYSFTLLRNITQTITLTFVACTPLNEISKMALNARAKLITFERFALNTKLIILVDLTNAPVERNGLYVSYYCYYATFTSLLRGQCTFRYACLWYMLLYPFFLTSLRRNTTYLPAPNATSFFYYFFNVVCLVLSKYPLG